MHINYKESNFGRIRPEKCDVLKFKVMQYDNVREIVLKLEKKYILRLDLNAKILILRNNFNQNIASLKRINSISKQRKISHCLEKGRIKYLYNEFERFMINIA